MLSRKSDVDVREGEGEKGGIRSGDSSYVKRNVDEA